MTLKRDKFSSSNNSSRVVVKISECPGITSIITRKWQVFLGIGLRYTYVVLVDNILVY